MADKLRRFEIYWANLDPTTGHEIRKKRPVVILSPDELNKHLGTVLAAPLTSTIRAYAFRPTVTVNGVTGQIALDQLRALDKTRLHTRLDELKAEEKQQVLLLLQEMFHE